MHRAPRIKVFDVELEGHEKLQDAIMCQITILFESHIVLEKNSEVHSTNTISMNQEGNYTLELTNCISSQAYSMYLVDPIQLDFRVQNNEESELEDDSIGTFVLTKSQIRRNDYSQYPMFLENQTKEPDTSLWLNVPAKLAVSALVVVLGAVWYLQFFTKNKSRSDKKTNSPYSTTASSRMGLESSHVAVVEFLKKKFKQRFRAEEPAGSFRSVDATNPLPREMSDEVFDSETEGNENSLTTNNQGRDLDYSGSTLNKQKESIEDSDPNIILKTPYQDLPVGAATDDDWRKLFDSIYTEPTAP